MKNSLKVLLGAVALLALPAFVLALEFKAGDQVSLPVGQNSNGDLYMAGGTVTSAGSVRGDLFAAGGSVLVTGPVQGDLFAGGGNITILGEIADDVRAAGGNIVIQGNVRGDVILGGGQINLASKIISGDAVIGGGTVRIDSLVAGDLKVGGGDIYINSTIAGNVDVKADKLTLGPKADIGGNLSYESKKEAVMEGGAVVRGETTFTERTGGRDRTSLAGLFRFVMVAKFFMLLVSSMLLGLFFRRYSRELVAKVVAGPLRELGRGVITFIALPVLSIILMVTVIGLPLGALGLLAFGALSISAAIAAPILLCSVVYKWIFKGDYAVNWKTILLGGVVFLILGLIPFVGWLAICLSMAMTLGAALNIKWGAVKEWR